MDFKIDRWHFLKLDEFTFSFNMTDHLNPQIPVDECLTAICRKISRYHKLTFPNWARLMRGHRIIRITESDDLFQYLDANSQRKTLNWLIFRRVGNEIVVTHFGPFGSKNDKDFEENVDQTRRSLKKLREALRMVNSSSKPEKQKEKEQDAIKAKIQADYWAAVQAVEEEIEDKKRELKLVANLVFCDEESRENITCEIEKITITTGWVIVKPLLKGVVAAIIGGIALAIAKEAAKQSAKQGAKVATKSIPILGFAAGAGFALWRFAQADAAGAALEIASGAASCVPGVGTAASLAIDTALVTKDIYHVGKEKKKQMEDLKASTDVIQRKLDNLFEDYETAKAEYDFVCEVLGDPGYDVQKLKHDIKVLNLYRSGQH